MKCSTCNAELEPQATVCPGCGTPVRQVSPETQPQTPPQPETVPPQEGAPQSGAVPPQGYAQPPYGMPQQPGTVPPAGYVQPPYGVPPLGYAPPFGYGAPTNVSSASGTISEQKELKTFQIFSSCLGWLGVGSFYAGYTQNGIRRIAFTMVALLLFFNRFNPDAVLILGICMLVANIVWSVVEAFTIKNDAKGVPMK